MTICEFKYDSPKYQCKEQAIPGSRLCIFHDEDYYKNNPQVVFDKLKEQIHKSITDKKHLLIIGYYLPNIVIIDNFTFPVYFIQVKFCGNVDFSQSRFSEVTFMSCEFSKNAKFSEAEFQKASFSGSLLQDAVFDESKFTNKADFVGTKFNKVSFNRCTFHLSNFSGATFREASFTSTKFTARAEFNSSDFIGKATFHQTEFQEVSCENGVFYKVDFTNAHFNAKSEFIQTRFQEANFSDSNFHDEVPLMQLCIDIVSNRNSVSLEHLVTKLTLIIA